MSKNSKPTDASFTLMRDARIDFDRPRERNEESTENGLVDTPNRPALIPEPLLPLDNHRERTRRVREILEAAIVLIQDDDDFGTSLPSRRSASRRVPQPPRRPPASGPPSQDTDESSGGSTRSQ
jgi:hypothetical protein